MGLPTLDTRLTARPSLHPLAWARFPLQHPKAGGGECNHGDLMALPP